jgi:outer membrane protein assembly factor BamA
VLAFLVLIAGLLAGAQPPEHLVDIQIHGNVLLSDADVIRIAGVENGMAVRASTVEEVAARLRASKKFEHVEVLKRFASIADPSEISLVIVVDEGPVTLRNDGTVTEDADKPPAILGVRKRTGANLMLMPILKFEDGYGFSYGARAAFPDIAGEGSRVSFPASWGGDKRAAAEFDRPMHVGLSRVQAGSGVGRRENPFFHENDARAGVWLRGDRTIRRRLRLGGGGEWQHVSFGGTSDRFLQSGGDVTLDTRIDPLLARNAVYARAGWNHLTFTNAQDANRTDVDLRGYFGLIGQSVLVVRGQRQDSNHPLPPYLRPLVGGTDTLRGFTAGSFVGDTLVGASADLRVPITSPLSFGKVGFSAFIDTATVYDKGQRVRDQKFQRGVGGGIWLSAAILRLDFYVAHGLGRSTRAQFAASALF